nr:MFS transporter [Chloroflexota bacterium]
GLRSLFPIITPRHLWERVNAVDSNGYVVATILGPPIAAGLVAVAGGPIGLIGVGLAFGVAALSMIGIPEPKTETVSTGRLLPDAWQGLVYAWRNPTIRGLGFSIATLNLFGGMVTIVIPLIVLDRLGFSEIAVGAVFAVSGLSGMASVLLWGRFDSRGREWPMLVWPMVLMAPAVALMLPAAGVGLPGGRIDPWLGLALLAASQALVGLLQGPLDIALFTVRQRRTDPAWMGRAFAVSMAFNFSGYPIGAALAGALAGVSLEAAIGIGIAACLGAAVFAAVLVPKAAPAAPAERRSAAAGALPGQDRA